MKKATSISQTSWQGFEKQLRTYVRSRVDPLWVDDVVGNILLRLVQNSDAFQEADNPAAYIQRVARNAVTDHYRRKAVERKALADVEADAKIGGESEAAEGRDAEIALARCLVPFINDLPRAYREALTLTEIEQLTQRQAADRLGLSLSGLKSRVQRGRGLLKRAITNCCTIQLDGRGGVVDYKRRAKDCGKGC